MYNYLVNIKLHLCVLMVVLGITGCGGKVERIAMYLDHAKTYFADNDYEKARIEFKNVLQMDPKNIDAIFGQAQVFEKLEKWRESAGMYQQVIEIDATRMDAKENLSRLYFLAGGPVIALELADEVLKINPDSAVALCVKGAVLAKKGDTDSAVKLVDKALLASPDHLDALMLKASLLIQLKENDEALQLLVGGLKSHPDHPGLLTVMAKINADIGREDRAIELLQQLMNSHADNVIYRGRLVGYYAQLKKYELAEKVLREGVSLFPEQNELKFTLVDFLLKNYDSGKAIAELKQFLSKDNDSTELQLALARLYSVSGKKAEEKETLLAIVSSNGVEPDALKARVELARLAASEGKYDEAQRLVNEVLTENPRDNDGLLIRGKVALLKNDFLGAVGDLRSILKDQPNSVEVLNLLGQAHLANEDVGLAKNQFEKALALSPNPEALRFDIGQLYLKYGQIDDALHQLELVSKDNTVGATVLETLFKAQMENKDYSSARATAKRVRNMQSSQSLGEYLAGLVDIAEDKQASAVKHFKTAIQITPSAVEPLKALINSRLAKKQMKEAIADVKTVMKSDPKHFAAQNILGELYLIQKKATESIPEFRKALVLNSQLAASYHGIAAAYIQLNEREKAIKVLEEGVKTLKHPETLVDKFAALYQQSGQIDKAIDVYDSALMRDPTSVVYPNNLAMLLVSNKKDQASLDKASKLIEKLSGTNNPAYLDTIGWVYYSRNDLDRAIPVLQQAVSAAPGQPLLQYHLGMAQYKKGEIASAKHNLQTALDGKKNFSGMEEAKTILQQIGIGS